MTPQSLLPKWLPMQSLLPRQEWLPSHSCLQYNTTSLLIKKSLSPSLSLTFSPSPPLSYSQELLEKYTSDTLRKQVEEAKTLMGYSWASDRLLLTRLPLHAQTYKWLHGYYWLPEWQSFNSSLWLTTKLHDYQTLWLTTKLQTTWFLLHTVHFYYVTHKGMYMYYGGWVHCTLTMSHLQKSVWSSEELAG